MSSGKHSIDGIPGIIFAFGAAYCLEKSALVSFNIDDSELYRFEGILAFLIIPPFCKECTWLVFLSRLSIDLKIPVR